jgi:hypothetical protein
LALVVLMVILEITATLLHFLQFPQQVVGAVVQMVEVQDKQAVQVAVVEITDRVVALEILVDIHQ